MSFASIKKLHEGAMPVPGLPEPLPEGERLLWQGSPEFSALARSAFHSRALMLYFGVILVAHAANMLWSGATIAAVAIALCWLSPLFAAALAMIYAMAWFTAKTTVYTITDKRVVMHIGVVLDLTLNLPFDAIDSAGANITRTGCGDLTLRLLGPDKIAYLHLWPHAKPWHIARPEPMLRSVPRAADVALLLGDALRARLDQQVTLPAVALHLVKNDKPVVVAQIAMAS